MEYLFLILYLAGIVFGADHLVGGAVSVARRFRVSDFVIGAAIVGVGTSMPELTVSFLGALKGNPDVAIGNVVGSNIFNVLGILGLTAVLCPIVIDRRNLKFEIPLCTGVSILLTLLAFNFFNGSNPSVGRVDGILLLALFAAFMWVSFTRDRKDISLTVERVEETVRELRPVCRQCRLHREVFRCKRCLYLSDTDCLRHLAARTGSLAGCSVQEAYGLGAREHHRVKHLQHHTHPGTQFAGRAPYHHGHNTTRLSGNDCSRTPRSGLWTERDNRKGQRRTHARLLLHL